MEVFAVFAYAMVVAFIGGFICGRLREPYPVWFEVDPDPLRIPHGDNVIELEARRAA